MGRGSRAHPSCNAAAVFVLALATAVAFATPATAVDASIQQLVDAREVEAKAIRDKVENLYQTARCQSSTCDTCTVNVCTDAQMENTQCNLEYGTPASCKAQTGQFLSLSESSVKVAEGVSLTAEATMNDVCFTTGLLDTFQINDASASTDLKWQYFGTPSGVWRQYPGQHFEVDGSTCQPYDPRQRPWYVAAATGARKLVLVLDVSASMSNAGRMPLAKSAGVSVLSALTQADWFSVVAYAGTSTTPNKFNTKLVQATADNIEAAKAWVNGLSPSGNTDFDKAFTAAFDILDAPTGSGASSTCLTTIVFMTDGVSNGNTGADAVSTVASRNAAHNAYIFTYSLGADADAAITIHGIPNYAKQIACENNGMWEAIPDGGDLPGKMSGYYQFLASGLSNDNVVWLEPYEDFLGLGLVTTAAIAAYDNTVTPKRLIGVVGVDVRLVDFGSVAQSDETLAFLTSKSQVCSSFVLTDCQMQALRKAAGDASVCDNVSCGTISNVPSNTCPANTVITNDVFCPGTQMSEDTSLDEVCCELDSFPVAAIIAIVIGVLVLVCLAACVYLFMQRQKVKQARYASERKRQAAAAVATPPPAAAPAPAPAGIEMTARPHNPQPGVNNQSPAGYAYPSYAASPQRQPNGQHYPQQPYGWGYAPSAPPANSAAPPQYPQASGGPGYPPQHGGQYGGYPQHGGAPGYPPHAGAPVYSAYPGADGKPPANAARF